jgi:FAD/FMN-containing dehydrogenase
VDTLAQHASDVEHIQAQMRSFFARGQKVKIYHGTTNSTRAQTFEKDAFVDVSRLDRIIEMYADEQYVLVEPNVPMDKLVEATLQHRLVPPVVPEFPGITVGGAVQGGAGESSSFKYGGVHDCCLQYELVLGNGELITASPMQNQDLFYGTACSYGSLGIITLVKLRLIPAKDFVRLTYRAVKSFDDAASLMEREVGGAAHFIDGIIFAKNRGVIMSGNFTDKTDMPVSTFSNRTDEWFYLHADNISKRYETYEELIPVRDYLFRYDRGAFWGGRDVCSFLNLPFTRFTRYILDNIFKARNVYRILHATNVSQRYLIQDLVLPRENLLSFLQFIDNLLHTYPLWLCPLLPGKNDTLSPTYINTSLTVNVGMYKEFGSDYSRFLQANRDIEHKVSELHGRKVLYAHSYYPQDEFWKIYSEAPYNALREKYFAARAFPDIYDKTKVVEKYKRSVFTGIWNALRSPKLAIS